MKRYAFEVLITDEGKVYVKHNCSSLIEFLGILETVKAVGLKLFAAVQEKEKKDSGQQRGIDPYEYLRQVQQQTQVVKVSGIRSLIQGNSR